LIRGSIAHDTSGQLAQVFVNGTIPPDIQSFSDLERYVLHNHLPHDSAQLPSVVWDAIPSVKNISIAEEAAALFSHFTYVLDSDCTNDKSRFWYRQPDGHCNWLKSEQTNIGSTGYPRSRDWGQTTYADGISKPREGPNPREVSNAFFKVSPLVISQNST
jgi:peroxidase